MQDYHYSCNMNYAKLRHYGLAAGCWRLKELAEESMETKLQQEIFWHDLHLRLTRR